MKEGQKYLLTAIAGLLISAAVILQLSFGTSPDSIRNLADDVAVELQAEISALDQEADYLREIIVANQLSFSKGRNIEGLFFVYENGEPVYWSTNQLLPDFYLSHLLIKV